MTRALPLALLLAAAAPTPAADDHPIVAAVKAKLTDPSKPFSMFVTFKVKAGKNAEFEAAVAAAIKGTVKEPGNVAYQLNHDPDHPDTYVLYERWKTLDALVAHMKTPHLEALGKALAGVTDGPPQVKAYHAVGE